MTPGGTNQTWGGRVGPVSAFQGPTRLWADGAVFFIPATVFLDVNLVGRLLMGEVLSLALFPFVMLFHWRKLFTRGALTVIGLGLLWLFAQMVTDFVRNTPFNDFARGWAKIGILVVNFCVLYILLDNQVRRFRVFACGIAMGMVLVYFLNPPDVMYSEPWKFGLGFGTALAVAAALANPNLFNRAMLPPAAFLGLGMFYLLEGARSISGTCLMAGVYLFLQQVAGRRREKGVRFSPVRAIFFFALGAMAAYGIMSVYSYAAREGLMGDEARRKYEIQSRGELGLLLGGRAELFVSSQAIKDSPIIGHGSWARDPYYAAMLLRLERFGYEVSDSVVEEGLIPTHSHLFGAWVEAGVFGAIFWMWVLWLDVRVLTTAYLQRDPLVPMAAFIGILILWDVLFSPFGLNRRLFTPFYLIVLLYMRDMVLSGQAMRRQEAGA